MNHDHRHQPDSGNGAKSRNKWVLIAFIAIAAYFLITEHKATNEPIGEVRTALGEEHVGYARRTPAFFPRLGNIFTRTQGN